MTKKESITMHNNHAEFKAVAKAVTRALKRQGYDTPHSAVLNALSGAVNKRNWHILKQTATTPTPEIKEQSQLPPTPKGEPVTTEFWTDCGTFRVVFDARPYLEQARQETLTAIMRVGYGNDYVTDNVAEYMAEHGLNEDLVQAFDYLRVVNQRKGVPTGFNCRISPVSYLRWLDLHDKALLAAHLCAEHGVTISEAQEEEIRGMWDWHSDTQACDHSYETAEDAELAAYGQLALLDEELKNYTD